MKVNFVTPMGLDYFNGSVRAVYPVRGALAFVHGASGCFFNPSFLMTLHDNYRIRLLASGMVGKHVIYGGEELLEESLEKAIATFRPEVLVILNSCIPSLTGDDTAGIAHLVSKRRGVKIITAPVPNYKGNQVEGFKTVVDCYVTDLMEKPRQVKRRSVNLLGVMPGEYNWTNNLKELIRLLSALGVKVNCSLVGDGTTVKEITQAPEAEANVLFYPEVGISDARLMEERFGTPCIDTELPPVGISSTRQWLLKVADFFGLRSKAELLLEEEMTAMGKALSRLEEGQIFHLQWLCSKTYAIEASPFQLPAMVKFLYEEFSMRPTTIAFQEYDASSYARLGVILKDLGLSPEIQTSGDHFAFKEAITRNYVYPYGDPWVVFGSTVDAVNLAFMGVRLPVIRFSFPVYDEAIITERPFVGFRGVVTLAENIFNVINNKIFYADQAFGYIPHPITVAQGVHTAARR